MVIYNIKNATQRQPSTNIGGEPTVLKGTSNGNERNYGADSIHVLKRHAGLVPYQRLGIDATCATIISARSVQCMVYDIVPERLLRTLAPPAGQFEKMKKPSKICK